MLKRWLQTGTSATWGKLDDAIISLGLSSTGTASYDVKGRLYKNFETITSSIITGNCTLTSHLKIYYINSRFMTIKDQWPPEQPKHYSPLVLVHQQGPSTLEETTITASAKMKGNIDQYTSKTSSNITKNIQEVFSKLEQPSNSGQPRTILVEGSPGIGKSVLLKHISYLWASNILLTKSDFLFLLYLRDPAVQQIKSVDDLIYHFYKHKSKARDHLFRDGGKSVTFLLDGYDELPVDLRQNSFISSLLQLEIFPACLIVVSSRPHVSTHLRHNVTCRIEILGFSEENQTHFIQQSLEGQEEKILEVSKYLQTHPTIASLCYTPFNMTMLLFLYKQQATLPTHSTDLQNLFICLTICGHLSKSGIILEHEVTDLNELPQPYSDIIKHLSKFAFKLLNNDQLVFSLAEVKKYCPAIVDHPNGFGLLQAVEYIRVMTKTLSFHFVHFSVQEFLAAYYVTLLSLDEECTIIEEYFWSDIHYNMFNYYVALTNGQSPSFQEFLRSGKFMSDKFLVDKLRLLRLYSTFHEAGDNKMCHAIEETFSDKVISLESTTLLPNNLESLATLLICSSCENWDKLDLSKCHIQDYGLQILHRNICCSNITIKELWLEYNDLSSSSDSSLSNIVITCKVKVLGIYHNTNVGETEQFMAKIFTDPSVIEVLYMHYNTYSKIWTKHLFFSLKENVTLRCLGIGRTNISDDMCDVICEALTVNRTLRELYIWGNPFTNQGITMILNALKVNNTLELLQVTKHPDCVMTEINLLLDIIHEKRKSEGCYLTLKIEFLSW